AGGDAMAFGWVKDAWDGVKDVAKSVGGYITGKEDAQTVQAPEMDESRFRQGGGREQHSSEQRANAYWRQAEALGIRPQDAQSRGAAPQVDQANQLSRQALGQWQDSRAGILDAANQRGPSAAQAQLQAGQDRAMAQQLAMARSGRGLGGEASAMRQAAFN